MDYPIVEHGGKGPPLHWAPANGFPAPTYQPLLSRLADRCRVVSLAPRGLWPEAPSPPSEPGTWVDLGDDLVRGLAAHQLTDVVAVGHSFGGVLSLSAAVRHRARFRALALLDPTILADPVIQWFRKGKASGWRDAPHPLAPRTRDRRFRFSSRTEAGDYFRGRKLFARCSSQMLDAFVDGGLKSSGDDGLQLVWPPAWEAYYYESIHLDVWDDVARLDSSLPVLLVGGGQSDTFLPEARSRFQALVPWADVVVVEGGGHLFPQEAPGRTIEVVNDWLARIGLA